VLQEPLTYDIYMAEGDGADAADENEEATATMLQGLGLSPAEAAAAASCSAASAGSGCSASDTLYDFLEDQVVRFPLQTVESKVYSYLYIDSFRKHTHTLLSISSYMGALQAFNVQHRICDSRALLCSNMLLS